MADRNQPLKPAGSQEAGRRTPTVPAFKKFYDPTAGNPPGYGHPDLTPVGEVRWFPQTGYTAPSDAHQEEKNRNALRVTRQEFIFMDTGRWLRDARDFGVVWGRHAYLCTYRRSGGEPLGSMRDGLDATFFQLMGGSAQPVQWASVSGAPEDDFDWDTLHIVIPDMHLMTHEHGAQWYGDSARLMQSELDFWRFSKRLLEIQDSVGKIKLIQIGDSWDLWVACKPLMFVDNEDNQVVLQGSNAVEQIVHWLQDIRGLLPTSGRSSSGNWVFDAFQRLRGYEAPADGNPAHGKTRQWEDGVPPEARIISPDDYTEYQNNFELSGADLAALKGVDGAALQQAGYHMWRNPVEAAFRRLEQSLNGGVVYIWGNHDDYLARADVCIAAEVAARQAYYPDAKGGLFVEHGHRLEFTLSSTYAEFSNESAFWAWAGYTVGHGFAGFNFDGGAAKAWLTTNNVYDQRVKGGIAAGWGEFKDFLGQWGVRNADQDQFYRELAHVWMGRLSNPGGPKPPHIFVIGHTHEPLLTYVRPHPPTRRAHRTS